MSGYRLSPAAQADLEDIWAYTTRTWTVGQAETYILDIRDACAGLASGDRIAQAADDIRPGYSRLKVGAHVLFLCYADDGWIDVIRILHQQMDIPHRL
jgi:toxin ParE1/3/4